MRTTIALVLLASLAAGCARPVSDKPWTTKNLWEAVDDERHAQEIYR
jgi:hypothetical protein